MSLEITIPDSFKQLLDKESEFYDGAMEAGTAGARNLLQRHYRRKGLEEPNRLGGKRSNFWADIGRSVQSPVKQIVSWVISITDTRIWQKIKGGKIEAKKAKALTIPIHKDAYNLRASVLQSQLGIRLFKIKTKDGDFVLAGEKGGVVTAYYLLKKSVNQKPWPGSLPEEHEMTAAFNQGVSEYMRKQNAS